MSEPNIDFVALMGPVACHLLGEPNRALSSAKELRFGTHGSISVDLIKGTWFDHEAHEGGGLLDLIRRVKGFHGAIECMEWIEREREGFKNGSVPPPHRSNGSGAPHPQPQPQPQPRPAPGREAEHYDYLDEAGNLLYQVVRYDPKGFRQRKPDGNGGWIWNISGTRQVPYRMAELTEALAQEHTVFIVEGEKDVNNMWANGLPATCNAMGAGSWAEGLTAFFAGADVVIIADNDPQAKNGKGEPLYHQDGRPKRPGQDHAHAVAQILTENNARRVRLLDLGKVWVQCPEKGDVSNFFEAGHSVEELNSIVEQLRDWTPEHQQQAIELFDPWQRYAVPAFPLDILPSTIKHFVTTQSEIIGGDRSALAMAALAALSGALDHQFALKMMRNGDWWVSPRLWVLLVGDPSTKRTPIINAATHELDRLQASEWSKYKNDKREYVAAGGDPEEFEAPEPPRFVAYDVTIEKLGMILGEQDRGILIKRDELAGWIGQMEKYATGRASFADRAFWLKAYDGGPWTVDRASREDIRIANLSCSILGGIQPARLAELSGLTSDGLLQRFLPVLVNSSTFPIDHAVTAEAFRYAELLRRLAKLGPQKLLLADDAVTAMEALRKHLHDLEHASGGHAEGFQGFVGKLAGLAGSLVLILTMAGDPDRAPGTRVQAGTIEDVDLLVREFILPHAFAFYHSGTGSDPLKRVASYVLTSGKTRVVPSDFTVNVADMRGLGLWDVNQRVSPLVAGGWLVPSEPGPVCKAWTVTPQVHQRFQDRVQAEADRKSKVAELLKSLKARKGGKT